jgi:uncharacterized membrane-anchored protein YitT (DUF2179 family)
MKSQPNIVRHVFDVVLLVVGSTVMALAYNLFLIPHQIVPGGVSGISMILNHFFQTPVGLVSLGLNIPLFILGVRVLGRTYGLKSLAGVVISCLMIDLFTYVLPVGKATDDIILACVFGGITLGAGLGLVFRGGGSTGGSDIVGQVLNRYTNLSIGSAILLTDTLIVSAAGAAFSSIELALYGFLNLYLATRTIDLVIEGVSYTRAMLIVSSKPAEVSAAITSNLGRGATRLHATGAYTGQEREVLLAVMSKKEVPRARDIVRAIDPHAFLIITDVYEVFGEGFRPRVEPDP